MKKWIKFAKPYGPHKEGDVLEADEAIARAYVEAGVALEYNKAAEDALAQADADLRSAVAEVRTQVTRDVAAAMRGLSTDGRPAVQVDAVDSRPRTAADAIRCIYGQAQPHDADYARACNQRLSTAYKDTVMVVDPDGRPVRRNMGELTGGTSLGFLVMPELLKDIYQIEMEQSFIEPLTMKFAMGAKELIIPALDQYGSPAAGTTSYVAGVNLFRKTEMRQRTETDFNLSRIRFVAEDLTGLTEVSRDLLADSSVSVDAQINQIFGRAFAWRKDYDWLRGTGVGEPLGIFNAPSLLTVTRTAATDVRYEDVIAMMSKLAPQSWGSPGLRWVTNVTTFPKMANLKSGTTFVYLPNSGISQGDAPMGRLLGIPVEYTEKVPALGTQGDLNLLDFGCYGTASRAGLEVGISEHFLFDTDQVAFRFKLRNDGRPMWRKPFIQADGASTQIAPFVQLV